MSWALRYYDYDGLRRPQGCWSLGPRLLDLGFRGLRFRVWGFRGYRGFRG